MTIFAASTGLVVGALYGYVAQRGAFCMNSGFRFVITKRDTTKVKAFGLAIAVQMILVPLLLLLVGSTAVYPSFHPVGAVVGGLLFGASMHWAGGCAAGVWYKVGAGGLSALAAVAGMLAGAASLELGPFTSLREAVQSVGTSSAPPSDLGLPLYVVPAVTAGVLLVLLLRTRVSTAGAWTWRRTGLLMGLTGAIAWPLSTLAGRDFGMAVVPGTVSLLARPLGLQYGVSAWDLLFVLGVPAGSYVAARVSGPVRISSAPSTTMLKRFAGGVGLGVGASLAAGCTVGHGLTGLPLLAPGSAVAMASIFAGSAAVALWNSRRVARSGIAQIFGGE